MTIHQGWIDPVRERLALDLRDEAGLIGSMDAARERVELVIASKGSEIRLTGLRSDVARRPIRVFLIDEVDTYPLPVDISEVLTAGIDISCDRIEVGVVGWLDGEPIAWQRGDVRSHLAGAYERPGWASRCLDPSTGLWETFRLSRRAARRQRGRDRAAARRARAALA